jgi:hypothetical protein
MTRRSFAWLLLFLPLSGAPGCGETIQQEYRIEIVGPVGMNYLAGAVTAVLLAGDKESRTPITPGAPFSVVNPGIDVNRTPAATFRFRALDPAGQVVAQGQTPEIELVLGTPPLLRIFAQKPGTFGRTQNMDLPRRNMIAAPARALVGSSRARPITVGYFGLGTVLAPDTMAPEGKSERPSEVYNLYNPLTHFIDSAGMSNAVGGTRQPRTDAAAVAHHDGRVLIYGGLSTPPMMAARPSNQLDLVQMARVAFDEFEGTVITRAADTLTLPDAPRARPALVDLELAYAIGGRAGDLVLDTILSIDPSRDDAFKILPVKMAGGREGHTATVVTIPGGREVLIFGGAAPGVAVAEVMGVTAAGPMLSPAVGAAGPARQDHGAVALPGGDRALVVGGRNAQGVLGDSVLYAAATRTLSPGPITLQKPRHSFAAFVIDNDLVVAGGLDASGAAIPDAEIFNLSGGMVTPRAVVPCHPRTGPGVIELPNKMVLLLGGTGADGKATEIVEIYQPN